MTRYLLCVAVGLVAGCSAPLDQLDRLDDVELSATDVPGPTTAQVSAAPEELSRRPGLFGLLRPPFEETEPTQEQKADTAENAEVVQEAAAPPAAEIAPEPQATPQRRGLFARLRSSEPQAETDASEPAAPADTAKAPGEPVEVATVAAPKPKRRGLFAKRVPTIDPNAPDAQLVSFGDTIPYGHIARVCDAPAKQLGRRIASYPETAPQYALYDSRPGHTGQRTHYVTGFADGCPRQFTAALALFGDPRLHEQLRYGLPSKVQPYSQSDEAYETVKSRVCRVGKGKPCGAKMDTLAKSTVFISTYARFQGSSHWANMLLHDGQVIEKDQIAR